MNRNTLSKKIRAIQQTTEQSHWGEILLELLERKSKNVLKKENATTINDY